MNKDLRFQQLHASDNQDLRQGARSCQTGPRLHAAILTQAALVTSTELQSRITRPTIGESKIMKCVKLEATRLQPQLVAFNAPQGK